MRRTNTKTTARKTTRTPAATPAKATPTKQAAGRDVTQYADKEPTELHKTFARWAVTEVGYDPNAAKSKREAFLMGVSIATAAKPAFQASDYLAAWYEESGTAKRGRGATATTGPVKGRKAKDADPVEDEEDYSEEEETEEDEEEEGDLEEELNSLAIGALRKTAKDEYGVSGAGSKQEIINRILDAVAEEEGDEEEDEESDDEAIDLDELEAELTDLSAADLKAAAKEYGVTPKRGEAKASLIDRILDSVAEEADEEDEDDEEDEEEETAPPAKGRGKAPASKGGKSKEFLF